MPHTFPIDLFRAKYDKSLIPKQISDSLPIKNDNLLGASSGCSKESLTTIY